MLKGSRWIPLEQIRRAYFHRGLLTDELQLELVNGRLMTFLWFPWDDAWEPLHSVLRERLGDGLTIK